MRRQYKRAAALIVLSCILTLTGNGRGFSIRAYAEKSNTRTIYDEMVFWGETAAYLYYYADCSGFSPDSILYYYCEKDSQEEIVKAQFEKMAIYALLSNFPERNAVSFSESDEYIYAEKEAFDTAAEELFGINAEEAAGYCQFFTLDGNRYVFAKNDIKDVIPESSAHGFNENVMSGYMCLTKNGSWVSPYEYDIYLEPSENGRYSSYRFSCMSFRIPRSGFGISTGNAEEEMVSIRLMAFLNHEPQNAFLSRDINGIETGDGTLIYECGGVYYSQEELSEFLCPDGENTVKRRVELGEIFKNGDHYIADYGEGLLEVKMDENRELTFIRNRRYTFKG